MLLLLHSPPPARTIVAYLAFMQQCPRKVLAVAGNMLADITMRNLATEATTTTTTKMDEKNVQRNVKAMWQQPKNGCEQEIVDINKTRIKSTFASELLPLFFFFLVF